MCDKFSVMPRGMNNSIGGCDPMMPQHEPMLNEEQLRTLANIVYAARIMLQGQAQRDFPRKPELELMADAMLAVSNALNKYTLGRTSSLEHALYFELKCQGEILKRQHREEKLNESAGRFC
jgi:hypothetical protein